MSLSRSLLMASLFMAVNSSAGYHISAPSRKFLDSRGCHWFYSGHVPRIPNTSHAVLLCKPRKPPQCPVLRLALHFSSRSFLKYHFNQSKKAKITIRVTDINVIPAEKSMTGR